jgi:hypothetical protein
VVREMAKKSWIRECQMEALEQEEAGRPPAGGDLKRGVSGMRASAPGGLDTGVDRLNDDEYEEE